MVILMMIIILMAILMVFVKMIMMVMSVMKRFYRVLFSQPISRPVSASSFHPLPDRRQVGTTVLSIE